MQAVLSRLRRSASLKVATIGFLVLVLLIPLAMIEDVIRDRDTTGDEAKLDIMRTWGAAQRVAGPVLVIPYERVRINSRGDRVSEISRAYVLPEDLQIDASMRPEVRYRGLYRVPVYSADMTLSGTIARPDLPAMGIPVADARWDDAYVAMAVTDARAITATPSLAIAGHTVRFEPGNDSIGQLRAPIAARVGPALGDSLQDARLPFRMTLQINGTDDLRFLPLGDTTRVTLQSDWESPSFVGNYLPESREIREDGFDATWKISNIGRALPSRWTDDDGDLVSDESAFGVRLYMPVGLYQLTLRAAKYGVLFIGLTFAAYFVFEAVAALRLHPLQYLLVGLANSLFFLLLLSLAEHTGFGWAYLISAGASAGLIVGYSHAILRTRARAAVMALILLLLYAFLYMTLRAESFALLAGSLGLWLSLALIMYLTRGIDWYGTVGRPDDSGRQD